MKKTEAINKVYEELNNRDELSIKDIMSITNCTSRTSAYSYISALKNQGIHILERKKGHSVIYYIDNNNENINNKVITKDDCYSFVILDHIKNHPCRVVDITWFNRSSTERKNEELRRKEKRKHSNVQNTPSKVPILENSINISFTKIRQLLKQLENDGFIVEDKSQTLNNIRSKVYKYNGKQKLVISQKDPSLIIDSILEMESIISGHLYHKGLNSICSKIKAIIESPENISNQKSKYIFYGKNFSGTHSIFTFYKKINKLDYKKNVIKFLMNNNTETKGIVCCFIYSVDNDDIYILCVNPSETTDIFLVNNSRVKEYYEDIPIEESYFESSKYIQIYNKMFGPDIDSVTGYKVKVKFQNIFNINKKLLQLCNCRNARFNMTSNDSIQAKLYNSTDGFLIYEDEIIGLHSFASYLRKFGSSCEVLEPPVLRDMMFNSCMKAIERYNQLDED